YGLGRALAARSGRGALLTAAMLGLGLLLAAFYALPALAELPGVRLGTEPLNSPDFFAQLQPPAGLFTAALPYRYYPDQGTAFWFPIPLWQALLTLVGVV